MVGYVRRNYMVPVPEAGSFEALNEKLLRDCLAYGQHRQRGQDRTVNELFEEEKAHLLPVPDVAFSNIQMVDARVNPYSTVLVDKNHYSVPTRFVGLRVRAMMKVGAIEIYGEQKRIASHQRIFGNNKWQLDPDHYLELLQQRPQAFASARPIRQWRQGWPDSLEQLLVKFQQVQGATDGIKDFISVLMLFRDHGPGQVYAAVDLAMENGIGSSSGVKHLLLHSSPKETIPPLAGWPVTVPADVSVYGQLGGIQ